MDSLNEDQKALLAVLEACLGQDTLSLIKPYLQILDVARMKQQNAGRFNVAHSVYTYEFPIAEILRDLKVDVVDAASKNSPKRGTILAFFEYTPYEEARLQANMD